MSKLEHIWECTCFNEVGSCEKTGIGALALKPQQLLPGDAERQCPKCHVDLGCAEAQALCGAGAAVHSALLPLGPTAALAGHLHWRQQAVTVVASRLCLSAV